jgi:hypothetical protein
VTDESVAIPGMNDEGWTGREYFSDGMWTEMEEIMKFRSLGYSDAGRLSPGEGDAPTGGPGGGIATWYKDGEPDKGGDE